MFPESLVSEYMFQLANEVQEVHLVFLLHRVRDQMEPEGSQASFGDQVQPKPTQRRKQERTRRKTMGKSRKLSNDETVMVKLGVVVVGSLMETVTAVRRNDERLKLEKLGATR